MRKELLLIAALIAPPNLANADASNTLNGPQVNPAGVPAPAAAAGFTTPVVQADFTVPGNFWSIPSNYIVNCGAAPSIPNTPSSWHFTWTNQFANSPVNCGQTIAIVTDTAVSPNVQALRLQYPASLYPANGALGLVFPGAGNTGSNTAWLPNEWYYKAVLRFDSATLAQTTGTATVAAWSTNLVKEGGGCCFFDEDMYEIPFYFNCSTNGITCAGGQIDEWPGPNGNYSPPWYNTGPITVNKDFTQYHTFEFLATSDESTGVSICQWVDGAFNACAKGALNGPAHGNNDYLDRGRSIIIMALNAASTPTNPLTFYLQSFQLWSCANFASGTCGGSTLTNGSPIGPTYYHN